MKDFGTALRAARMRVGLSLEDIHEATRISLKHLRAIEAGDFPSLPPTYIRAFIREYARIVGLDEEETVRAYNECAERLHGIPKPPESIDHSHILPQLDDTIEIIGTKTDEATGENALEHDQAVPALPSYHQPSSPPVDNGVGDKQQTSIHDTRQAIEIHPRITPHVSTNEKSDSATFERKTWPSSSGSSAPPREVKRESVNEQSQTAKIVERFSAPPPLEKPQEKPKTPEQTRREPLSVRQGSSIPSSVVPPTVAITSSSSPRRKQDRKPSRLTQEEWRFLIVGSAIIAIIALGIFALIHFQSGNESTSTSIDSSAILSSLESETFIDSAQATVVEPSPLAAGDSLFPSTLTAETVAGKQNKSVREDSLVLEAFSSSSVWYWIKMDTTRTEKGNMSTNDHRVWKARDRFVVTLGDGGAITFFLNGKEIGTLGESGAVVRNIPISRDNLGSGN
ncbi:MAG: DUF4115 domain-containing protein [Bacteroidota bacterium]|nr:DUF4115 domain-containing protein [Bacteroidota bacterium]